MNAHTHNSDIKNILKGLGLLMATAIQYTNAPAIYAGKETGIRRVKPVKGDEAFNIIRYTQEYLQTVQDLVDIEQELESVFEGFLIEESLVPCEKSELKNFFQLMYEGLKGKIVD